MRMLTIKSGGNVNKTHNSKELRVRKIMGGEQSNSVFRFPRGEKVLKGARSGVEGCFVSTSFITFMLATLKFLLLLEKLMCWVRTTALFARLLSEKGTQ